jgi:hypothetical protein
MTRIILANEAGGDNQAQLKRAFGLAQEICKEGKEIESCVLYIPTQQNTAPLENLLGDKYKEIGKGLKLFKDGPVIRILTDKTIQTVGASDVIVISIYCRIESVKKVDGLHNCKAIIAIPFLKDELNDWASMWSAVRVNEKGELEGFVDKQTISSSIVKNAVDEFPISLNISHNLGKDLVASKFKILRKHNIQYNTSEIASYLVSERGWTQESAEEVKKLGDKINDGKRIQAGSPENDEQAIERWKNNNR